MTGHRHDSSFQSLMGSLVRVKLPHFKTDSCEVGVTIPNSQVKTQSLEI